MSVTCTRCEGTGFLNNDHRPDFVDDTSHSGLSWLMFLKRLEEAIYENGDAARANSPLAEILNTDFAICDCCGDGETWYGRAGEHYNADDPKGPKGPYASNGGLCRCH